MLQKKAKFKSKKDNKNCKNTCYNIVESMKKYMLTKSEIRIKNKKIRKNLDINEISKKIIDNLFGLEEFQVAQNIFVYISTPKEINTFEILNIKNKKIYVPKIINNTMVFTDYTPNSLTKNKFGILEPEKTNITIPLPDDIVIVPAIAADKNFNRIGYGGGFYDKFLSTHKCKKILLIPDICIIEKIPQEPFDVKVDIIISENRIINS